MLVVGCQGFGVQPQAMESIYIAKYYDFRSQIVVVASQMIIATKLIGNQNQILVNSTHTHTHPAPDGKDLGLNL